MYLTDPENGQIMWQCPKCKHYVHIKGESALTLVKAAGACQGCRAKATLEKKPELVGIFLDFFASVGAPESPVWMEAIREVA